MNNQFAPQSSTKAATIQFVQAIELLIKNLRVMVHENNTVIRHSGDIAVQTAQVRLSGGRIMLNAHVNKPQIVEHLQQHELAA